MAYFHWVHMGIRYIFCGEIGVRLRFQDPMQASVFCDFLTIFLPCVASFRARRICDAAGYMDLIASRASKKEADLLVGHDLPQISRAGRLLILPWKKFSVPIIICSLRPVSYLVVRGSGGMDPTVIQIRMSW
jgi:hypothetical protein